LKDETPTIEKLNNLFDKPTTIKFSQIFTKAKQLYLKQHITDEQIDMITKFIEDHNQYPNRKELIENKILVIYTMRNITRVVKPGKPADAIAAYYEEVMKIRANAAATQ
jgi:hypothetical protein